MNKNQNISISIFILLLVWLNPTCFAIELESDLFAESDSSSIKLDVFPQSSLEVEKGAKTYISKNYNKSESLWFEGANEKQVFQAEISNAEQGDKAFSLRVGKGGQIYSLRGAFGESVPPSSASSPWNDEVWQFVAVCSKYNKIHFKEKTKPYKNTYFIHNSGCYIPSEISKSLKIDYMYSPQFASDFNEEAGVYRQLNWGLIPQIKTIHRSPLLYYMQVRNCGKGVLEITWVVHNFDTREEIVFDHLNAPWGGTRITSLPIQYISRPGGKLEMLDAFSNPLHNGINVRDTGGFNIASQNQNLDSPALSLVFGLDKHLERDLAIGDKACQFASSIYRSWRAGVQNYAENGNWRDWEIRATNSFRNYDVAVIIPKLRLKPQSSIWYRSYLVVGGRDDVTKRSKELIDHVDYGYIDFKEQDTPLLEIKPEQGKKSFHVYAKPVSNTLPIFKIRHKTTGKVAYTTDIYLFTPQTPLNIKTNKQEDPDGYYANAIGYQLDGKTQYLEMIGFGHIQKPKDGNWVRLSDCVNTEHHYPQTLFNRDVWVKIN